MTSPMLFQSRKHDIPVFLGILGKLRWAALTRKSPGKFLPQSEITENAKKKKKKKGRGLGTVFLGYSPKTPLQIQVKVYSGELSV